MIPDIVELKDVALISSGNSAPQDQDFFKQGSFNFYRTSDVGKIHIGPISNSLDKLNQKGTEGLKLFNIGTILFPKSGASTFLNHRAILEKEGYVSSHLAAIKANNKFLLDKFLFYLLTTIDAKDLVQDASYPSLKLETIEKIKFQLPSLSVQQKIVSKLDAIFLEIEKAFAATETNIENAEVLFESYLTKVFQLNCKNFKKYSIGDICKIIGGGTPSKANLDFYKGNIPWATVRDMNVDIINETDCKISEKAVELSSTNIIPKNSLVIATRVGLGKVCILGQDTAINQDLKGIIPIDNLMLDTLYLFYWFKSVARKIIAAGRGATVNGVTLPFIRSLEIMLPELANQKIVIQNTCDLQSNLNRLKILNQKKINELLLLKQSILKHAFSGELISYE